MMIDPNAPELHPRARALVRQLGMQPHPEGGWYVEVYRSARRVRPDEQGPASRDALTAIYFLLGQGQISRWHLVDADEVWCHLEGAPVALHRFNAETARIDRCTLGPVVVTDSERDGNSDSGSAAQSASLPPPDALQPPQQPQATVPAGVWQAAHSLGDFSLVACFVAPGFEFAGFRLMSARDAEHGLLKQLSPATAPWVAD